MTDNLAWSATKHDEIIKRLMNGIGQPNSQSLYGAFKQFANELCALNADAPSAGSPASAITDALFPADVVEDGGKCITTYDASLNLQGALYDLKRYKSKLRPPDDVCIRTIERVVEQLEQARAALTGPFPTTARIVEPSPRDGDAQFVQAWILNEVLCEIMEGGTTESREIAARAVTHPRIKCATPLSDAAREALALAVQLEASVTMDGRPTYPGGNGRIRRLIMRAAATLRKIAAPSAVPVSAWQDKMIEAVRGYHLALDRREHGSVACHRAMDEIMRILDMPWKPGVELARHDRGSEAQ